MRRTNQGPDITAWAGSAFPLPEWSDDSDPAVDTTRLIAEKPSSITVSRGAETLAAQTVRIEALGRPRFVEVSAGLVVIVEALVLAEAGADLQAGDRFAAAGVAYEIVGLAPAIGDSLQAYAKVRQ